MTVSTASTPPHSRLPHSAHGQSATPVAFHKRIRVRRRAWLLIGGLFALACLTSCNESDESNAQANTPTTLEQQGTSMKHPEPQVISASSQYVKVTGRTLTAASGARTFGYPGVSFELAVSGGDLSVIAKSTSDDSYISVQVDNQVPAKIKLSTEATEIPLLENDGSPHLVKVTHLSETWHGIVTVQSFSLKDGNFEKTPEDRSRRLMVIGDSVTCGEGVSREGVSRTARCEKDSSWWNAEESYGKRIGRALGADTHLICYGGRGLTRSWDGSTQDLQAPDFYELTIPQKDMPRWDHSAFQPDLILVSLGTNDFSLGIGALPEENRFVETYVRFVRRLLEQHPQAHIVLTEGAMVNDMADPTRPQKTVLRHYIAETVKRVGTERVHQVPSAHYPGDSCDAHPTGPQHAAMAQDLIPLLREIMEW